MAVTTAQLADYLRLPPGSTDDLNLYLSAAQSKARSAGVPELEDNALYDLFILSLAAMFYDHRGMTFSNPAFEAGATRMINAFVLALRYVEGGSDG